MEEEAAESAEGGLGPLNSNRKGKTTMTHVKTLTRPVKAQAETDWIQIIISILTALATLLPLINKQGTL